MNATNAQNTAKKNSPLKVVPPNRQVPDKVGLEKPAAAPPPTGRKPQDKPKNKPQDKPKNKPQDKPQDKINNAAPKKKSGSSLGSWLMLGFLVAGGWTIGNMPVTNYVTGEAEITSKTNARQRFTMPIAGTVQILVESNELVKPGERIANIISPELERQIAEKKRLWQQAEGALRAAEQKFVIAETRLDAARSEEAIASRRAEKKREEIEAVAYGDGLPKSRQIEHEIEAMNKEIAGIEDEMAGTRERIGAVESEIAAIENNIAGFREQLIIVEDSLANRQELVDEGALAKDSPEMRGLRMQRADFQNQIKEQGNQIRAKERQIAQIESEIRSRESLIEQKYRQIDAKSEQILEVEKQMQDSLGEREDELEMRSAARRSAEKEVTAAAAEIQTQHQAIADWQTELEILEEQKKDLIVIAEHRGTVLTDELDLKNNTRLEAGQEILSLVDLEQLTATVKIEQEDKNLVAVSQPVSFKSRTPDSPNYKATVESPASFVAPETPGGKPVWTVQIKIDNANRILLPGEKGYAHIKTGEMLIYQKAKHEVEKLLDLDKYFPWL